MNKQQNIQWQTTDGMIYNLVDSTSMWVNGERPQINQYMIRLEYQKSSGGSDEELKKMQEFILSALADYQMSGE